LYGKLACADRLKQEMDTHLSDGTECIGVAGIQVEHGLSSGLDVGGRVGDGGSGWQAIVLGRRGLDGSGSRDIGGVGSRDVGGDRARNIRGDGSRDFRDRSRLGDGIRDL
jgi:hypothetical protein